VLHIALEQFNNKRLRSYEADPGLLKEHFGIEETVLAGGYGYRQILELVQNAADALLEASERGDSLDSGGRIRVQVRGSRLYVANNGASLSEEGLDSLLRSHSSPKRGNQIGRFGLGFKSLLKLEGRIDIFTRDSGAIRFDPGRCRNELCSQFQVTQAPGLRLAWPLPQEERAADPVCAELAWAETIVRVEMGSESLLHHIRQEIQEFPAAFLLFFPIAAAELDLDDGRESVRKVNLSITKDAEHILRDGDDTSRWRVATREVRITEARALEDATHIHARESVPVAWAMPIEGRYEEAGRFWAFLPTHTQTYVPGIVNAPWKLNSDRNALIGGEWNAALMAEAASLIAETLPSLATPDDPARPLDVFPRQLDRKDEDAAPLVESLWTRLEAAAVIPDGTGVLRRAQDLLRHPKDIPELVMAWQLRADTDLQRLIVHASCTTRQRASRLNTLADRLGEHAIRTNLPALRRSSIKLWFALVASVEAEAALCVLKLAELFSNELQPREWLLVRSTLAIIPTPSGNLVTPASAVLVPQGVTLPGREPVSAELLSSSDAQRLLKEVMGISELDNKLWKQILVEILPKIVGPRVQEDDAGWQAFWMRLRLAPESVCIDFLNAYRDQVLVCRRDKLWVRADRALRPGKLVGENAPLSQKMVLVDSVVHENDEMALTALGVLDVPAGDKGPARFSEISGKTHYLQPWLDDCRNRYENEHNNSATRPYLNPDPMLMPRGYELLAELNGEPKARFTCQLLDRLAGPGFPDSIRFGHDTVKAYPKIDVCHPLPWFVLEHGEVELGASSVPLKALVARHDQTILQTLPNWSLIAQVLGRLQASCPSVPPEQRDLKVLWDALIKARVSPSALDGDSLTDLWLSAARDGVVPTDLPSMTSPVPLSTAFVTTSSALARRARNQERIVVVLDPPTMRLWLEKGAQDLAGVIQAEWQDIMGPPERLTNALPELDDVLKKEVCEVACCQCVAQLRMRIADAQQAAPCLTRNGVLLIDSEQLAPLSRTERLRLLLAEIAASGWLDCTPEVALRRLGDARVEEQRAHVAQGATPAERLLRAVGGRVDPLRNALGRTLCNMDFVHQCSPQQLAELVLAQLGPAALTVLKDTLKDEGLQPPNHWNTSDARAFVASIGFPPEFGSSTEARRESEEMISGPIELPSLHDFQLKVLDGLRNLLAPGKGRRRAVISLPTGGGKTRVTVEAAVRLVLAPEGVARIVLWIAQSDELCEQAVQAFRQVWVNLGARRTNLRIVRLWGGNPNPKGLQPDKPTVIVASIQTMNSRIGAALDELRKPGLLVVDECHHAITQSYNTLLRWLNAETPPCAGAAEMDEPPIVGLSATPFRTNDDESKRLARRFDKNWLPSDQERLYERLLSEGVLARTDYESLDSGIGLTDDELEKLGKLPEPWKDFEFEQLLEAINKRLAGDAHRNERMLECIQNCAERSILFFTNSVAHAEEMAARLNVIGFSAAAISGETPTVARRYFVDRFQSGQIRVLCNHSVLTTGFDAPKTDMILIARQVFSPVSYMQMVGRGLRGEKNGGTSKCRIVTVMDNLGRFQDRHPYHYCRNLYSTSAYISAATAIDRE